MSDARQRRAASDTETSTRDELLAAARRCVAEHGIAATSSRQIAAAAGANLASITYYFGSKDTLVAEAMFGELERRLAVVFAALEGDAEPAARLLLAVQEVTAEFERNADDVPVFLQALLLAAESGERGEPGRRLVADLRNRLAEHIRRLAGDGAVASWVRPDAMAALLVAAANGVALQSRLEPDGPSVDEIVAQLAGLLLAAAVPAPTPKRRQGMRS